MMQVACNKAKRRILKRSYQENKARQIFRKNKHFLPPNTHSTRAYQGVRNIRFSENLACFVFMLPPPRDSPLWFITDEVFCLITDEV